MQRTDVISDAIPVSLLYDRVVQAKSRTEVHMLVKHLSAYEHFHNDRDLMNTLSGRFHEISEPEGKRNWAHFCLQILLKKDYIMLSSFREDIQSLSEQFAKLPDFKRGALQMQELLKIKQQEYVLSQYIQTLFHTPEDFEKGILTHSWFFDSQSFIVAFIHYALINESAIPLAARGLEILFEVEPEIFSLGLVRKTVRKFIPLAASDVADRLYDAFAQIPLYPASLPKPPTPRDKTKVPEWHFDECFAGYLEDKEEEVPFSLIASDLADFSRELFLTCHLPDFERLSFSAKQSGAIARITHEFDTLSEFVKRKIVNAEKLKARAIMFFIKLAEESYRQSDHHTTFAILSALESSEVSYPSKVWKKVDSNLSDKKQFMVDKFSPLSNYKNFRTFIKTYEALNQPYTPFLGPFLAELTFAHVGNPDLKDNLINWEKVKMLGSVLERLFKLQKKLAFTQNYTTDIVQMIHKEISGAT